LQVQHLHKCTLKVLTSAKMYLTNPNSTRMPITIKKEIVDSCKWI
jgi:hypothetical protein